MAEPTKTKDSENFPVASLFLSADVREQVLDFYQKARHFDDIADSPDISCEDKLNQLSNETDNVFLNDLLKAFRQDCVKQRYQSWDELLEYCQYSANPVGRFLLEAHREQVGFEASDALCTVLQILNHLQDCQKDFETMGRIYLPADLLSEGTFENELKQPSTSPALRSVLDECLTRCDELIKQAILLPKQLKNRRLRYQARVTVLCALALAGKLRRMDPLATRVELTRLDMFLLAYKGLFSL